MSDWNQVKWMEDLENGVYKLSPDCLFLYTHWYRYLLLLSLLVEVVVEVKVVLVVLVVGWLQ